MLCDEQETTTAYLDIKSSLEIENHHVFGLWEVSKITEISTENNAHNLDKAVSVQAHEHLTAWEAGIGHGILTDAVSSLNLMWFGFQVSAGHDGSFWLCCLLHKNERQRL